MSVAPIINTHVVDILGSVIGRDQPVMMLERACDLVSLLSLSVLQDEDTVFFDPFCKAGEILLSCALTKHRQQFSKSKKLVAVDEIQRELYESKRYFALAPDERHHRLSLRTFLGNTHSHNEQYTHIIKNGNYLSEIDGRLDEAKFKEELKLMIEYIKETSGRKKIVAVGNPPYQESDGGFGKSAKNIYQFFAEALVASPDISEFVLVIPARWFGGGKGMDNFRDNMMKTPHLENLKYFARASDVFPTVDINGGICFLHYNKSYNGPTNFTDKHHSEQITFSEFDIIPDDPLAFSLIRKVKENWKKKFVGDVAWSRNAYGLATNYFTNNKNLNSTDPNAVPVLSRNRIVKYIHKNKIPKNQASINEWKVSVPKAVGGSKGQRRSTVPTNQVILIEKGMITTETYNIIDTFNSKKEAENFIAYLRTDFVRYLVGLRKITQDLPPDRWNWVPYMDMSKVWTDAELYKFFKITKEEQEHIKSKIEEWS
jgi:Eco57I restriction-modification methylase